MQIQGCDISDYNAIDPRYGDLADVDELRDRLHERGMKLVLDLIVNHTSDQHEWFRQSSMSKDNPFRDWYIWKPHKRDAQGIRQPPNNWESHFQGAPRREGDGERGNEREHGGERRLTPPGSAWQYEATD